MYQEDNEGNVVLTVSHDDYQFIIMGLGCLAATLGTEVVEVANRVNEGNPRWTAYETKAKIEKMKKAFNESDKRKKK